MSGIGTACQLSTALPSKTFTLLERRERLGGTWDLFRYPGIRSDADMTTLGYGFRLWRDPRVLADGAAIRRYLAETAVEYGVDKNIRYGLRAVSADWSSTDVTWTITAVDEATGQLCTYTCDFLINCAGYYDYDTGYSPEFPGIEGYTGQTVHPQHWPEDLDYKGKKVVVVGSGATAVTLVPAMAADAEHVTMLQRSPSYVFSLPGYDKISEALSRVLPSKWVWAMARRRNVLLQRKMFLAFRRWPHQSRRFMLWFMRRQLGPTFDMSHFTPTYMPWDERMCMASDGDLFDALKSGDASVVTDKIERFTETGILLNSGHELEADIVVTATGLNLKMLGGMRLTIDGSIVLLGEKMAYKGILVQDIPNFAVVFGYTSAAYTLKSDLAGAYLCRLLSHMMERRYTAVLPHDSEGCVTSAGVFDTLKSGYIRRGGNQMPRQGSKLPWKTLMHYERDRHLLLKESVADGVLLFTEAPLRLAESSGVS
ncbi:putative FAD-containing monooxygenase MymA [Mycolicibacterium celeriflavum]|uniref:Putative FAD-containing monooxygenase MymA n=1 Tax=Mycolicibacterium celeriflavum TaxID=1249101 RepID=A0A7I7RJ68_MYCCF|nr:putative FAD-containing monooxygenase MymA [Mycolicibacterium celeriflavum]